MPEAQTLAQMVRAKYPGAYDDLSDVQLEAKVTAKYPHAYDDLTRTAQGHIGPITGSDTAPVTLGELIDNPSLAVQRMVSITKKALTDPKEMIPILAGAVISAGARMRDVPIPPEPPVKVPGISARLKNVNPDDVAGMMPGPVRSAYRVGKALLQKPAEPAPPAPPPEVAPTPPPTPAAAAPSRPVAKRPPQVEATIARAKANQAARQTKASKSAETTPAATTDEGSLPSLDELHLTPAEITTAVKWHEQGVSPEVILHRILQSRQLTARTKTTTPDQASEAVRYRNEKGRWPNE